MKDWILKHKKLYFFIVGFIAFLAFTIITLIGLGKVYDAEAATDITYNDDGEMKSTTVYDIRELSWDYWLNNTQPEVLAKYDNPENLVNDIIAECNYWVVIGGTEYYFFIEPFYHDGSLSGQCNIYMNHDNGYKVTIGMIDGIPSVTSVVGMYDNSANTDTAWSVMYNGGSNVVGSTYDFLVNCTDSRKDAITRNNLKYPIITSYSVDAPYVTFENLFVDNKLVNAGMYFVDSFFEDIGKDALSESVWKYNGRLENFNSNLDDEYYWMLRFRLELPTFDHMIELFARQGVSYYSDMESKVLRALYDAWLMWNGNKDAPIKVYEFDYPIKIEPDVNGRFSFQFTFEELMTFIKYFYPDDARHELNQYSDWDLSLYLSFLHVDVLSGSVRTTRGNEQIYGYMTTDDFERGIYDVCREAIIKVDLNTATPEEIDKAISDAFSEAQEKYIADLEGSIEEIQKQIDDLQSVEGAFGGLEVSDIWTGFKSTVTGLASLGASVGVLSSLAGSVLAFMPLSITGIMSSTILAVCIIAIVKAIRG